MIKTLQFVPILLILSLTYGQSAASPNPAQLEYFRFLFMNVAAFDSTPAASRSTELVTSFEQHLASQVGVNAQESAAIHAAASAYATTLQETSAARSGITHGKTVLSSADLSSLSALNAQVENQLASQAIQLLSSVRPETATRLLVPGQIAAAAQTQAKGGR